MSGALLCERGLTTAVVQSQQELCQKYQAECEPPDLGPKLGITQDFFSGKMPLNGLRHPPEGDTCGWYLWAGEQFPEADDAFDSLHIVHLVERASEVVKYFGLAPGWRFLIADDYEDVWFDPKLLEIWVGISGIGLVVDAPNKALQLTAG